MDAPEMMAEVVNCEQRLRNLIQREVNKEITLLLNKTGLDITGMHINFMDVTCVGNVYKSLILSNVEIDVCLPDKL